MDGVLVKKNKMTNNSQSFMKGTVILTGSLNTHLFSANIDKEKVYVLKDKALMEATLAKTTRSGDLILFANDAPNFI